MAVTHNFTILCEFIMRGITGSYSFNGTIVNLQVEELPVKRSIGIGLGFNGEPDSGNMLSIHIYKPDGGLMQKYDLSKVETPYARRSPYQMENSIVAFMLPLVCTEEGVYHFVFQEGETILHDLPFGVFLNPEQKVEGNTDINADD